VPDRDGYPTEAEVERVKAWEVRNARDAAALLRYLRTIWWNADWGFPEEASEVKDILGHPALQWSISTGGWSGNEELVGAMQVNQMFWMVAWFSSRRGGHYQFQLPLKELLSLKKPAGPG
jgi:hypothetical protein